jgi:hypothetical protein
MYYPDVESESAMIEGNQGIRLAKPFLVCSKCAEAIKVDISCLGDVIIATCDLCDQRTSVAAYKEEEVEVKNYDNKCEANIGDPYVSTPYYGKRIVKPD